MSGIRRMKAKRKIAEAEKAKKVKAPAKTKKKAEPVKKKKIIGKSSKASE